MTRGTTWLAAALVLVAGSLPSNAESLDSALAQIKAAKHVTIGFRETAAPFSFLNESHQPAGYSIDVYRQIVKAIGKSIGDKNLQIKFIPVTPQSRIPLIANGTIQMECGTTVNSLARQRQVDFTYAVALSEGRMLVSKNSGITSLQSLQGKVIAIASGTTADRYVPAALTTNKVNARIIHVKDNDDGLLAVSTGRADAFVNDAVLLGGTLKNSRDKNKLEVVGDPLSFEQVAFMIPKNNSDLMTIANSTIARMLASGELQSLYDKWVAPYGAPREGVTEALFKVEAIEE